MASRAATRRDHARVDDADRRHKPARAAKCRRGRHAPSSDATGRQGQCPTVRLPDEDATPRRGHARPPTSLSDWRPTRGNVACRPLLALRRGSAAPKGSIPVEHEVRISRSEVGQTHSGGPTSPILPGTSLQSLRCSLPKPATNLKQSARLRIHSRPLHYLGRLVDEESNKDLEKSTRNRSSNSEFLILIAALRSTDE
jgi:hypothetical protein